MKLSIYSSWFNVEKMRFAWRETLSNWVEFLQNYGEIVIAVNKSEDNSSDLIRSYVAQLTNTSRVEILVIDIDIPYTNPEFDGMGKAAALDACTGDYCILLDCDERLPRGQKKAWQEAATTLQQNAYLDALMIPVVDLIGDERHYKSIGTKWYLHVNSKLLTRGVFSGGYRPDGTIDVTKSDTCELIYKESKELARAAGLLAPLPHYLLAGYLESGQTPYVLHYGWLDKEQRLRQSEFWRPVWANRNGTEVQTESTLAELDKIPKFRHNLPT